MKANSLEKAMFAAVTKKPATRRELAKLFPEAPFKAVVAAWKSLKSRKVATTVRVKTKIGGKWTLVPVKA